MKKIAIYTGKGAYMAKDIEAFLSEHSFDYERLNENDIQKGDLLKSDIFIIGGGSIFDIIPALKQKGINEIQKFVKNGGKYIGICAGAYIASEKYYDRKGKEYKGLGLVKTIFERGKGEKTVNVKFLCCGENINLFYCNGPLIKKLGKDEELIAVDKTGKIGIIRKEFGKGLIFLFSAHPEGNLYKKITAKDLDSELFFKKLITK